MFAANERLGQVLQHKMNNPWQ